MIRYSYSDETPAIKRLQGGILYPHGIEQVEGEGGIQYRFKLLKLSDTGQDISDYEAFTSAHQEQISAILDADIDLQAETPKRQRWEEAT